MFTRELVSMTVLAALASSMGAAGRPQESSGGPWPGSMTAGGAPPQATVSEVVPDDPGPGDDHGQERTGPCTAQRFLRTTLTNVTSLTVTLPTLGSNFTATVNLNTTNHQFAKVFAFMGAGFDSRGLHGVILVDRNSPLIFRTPPLMGPVAVHQSPIPNDPVLCNLAFTVQARHFTMPGPGHVFQPFKLTNAYDLVIGN